MIDEALPSAIDRASLEVREGLYEPKELVDLFDRQEICDRAFKLIKEI